MKNFRLALGFTLMELMVGLALGGGIGLMSMHMMSSSVKSTKQIATQLDEYFLVNQTLFSLSDEINCMQTFKPYSVALKNHLDSGSALAFPISEIRVGGHNDPNRFTVLFKVDAPTVNFTVKSIDIKNFTHMTTTNSGTSFRSWTGELVLTVERRGKKNETIAGAGGGDLKTEKPIQVWFDFDQNNATNPLVFCRSTTYGSLANTASLMCSMFGGVLENNVCRFYKWDTDPNSNVTKPFFSTSTDDNVLCLMDKKSIGVISGLSATTYCANMDYDGM